MNIFTVSEGRVELRRISNDEQVEKSPLRNCQREIDGWMRGGKAHAGGWGKSIYFIRRAGAKALRHSHVWILMSGMFLTHLLLCDGLSGSLMEGGP